MPKVSVIVPVYNQGPYLAECLNSVLAQSLREIEVICVDDGSTDGSGRMLDEYAARDGRVKVIHQANAGAGPARNAGLATATGEYIAFMDPDDMYPDGTVLGDMHSAAVSNGARICGGSFMEFLPNGAERTRYEGDMAGMSFAQDGFVSYADWQFDYGFFRFLYFRRLLQENGIVFPPYARYQDPPFFVRAMHAAGRFYALRRVTYRYRICPGTVNWRAGLGFRFRALCRGLRDVAAFANAHGYAVLAERQVGRACGDFGTVFSDKRLRLLHWPAVRSLCRTLGSRSFDELERKWAERTGTDLAARRIGVDAQAAYVGDTVNFGKAYADGMLAIRKGRIGHE